MIGLGIRAGSLVGLEISDSRGFGFKVPRAAVGTGRFSVPCSRFPAKAESSERQHAAPRLPPPPTGSRRKNKEAVMN